MLRFLLSLVLVLIIALGWLHLGHPRIAIGYLFAELLFARILCRLAFLGVAGLMKQHNLPATGTPAQHNGLVAFLMSDWTHLALVAAVALHRYVCK